MLPANPTNAAELRRTLGSQGELKSQVLALEPFVGEGAVVLSPATRNVFFRLGALLDLLVDHEERHCRPAMEVLGPQARGG